MDIRRPNGLIYWLALAFTVVLLIGGTFPGVESLECEVCFQIKGQGEPCELMPCNKPEEAKAAEQQAKTMIVEAVDQKLKPWIGVEGAPLADGLIDSDNAENEPLVCFKDASTLKNITDGTEYNFILAYCNGRRPLAGFLPREQPYVQNASQFYGVPNVDLKRNHLRKYFCDEKFVKHCRVRGGEDEHQPLKPGEGDVQAPPQNGTSIIGGAPLENGTNPTEVLLENGTSKTDTTAGQTTAKSSAPGLPNPTLTTIIIIAAAGVLSATSFNLILAGNTTNKMDLRTSGLILWVVFAVLLIGGSQLKEVEGLECDVCYILKNEGRPCQSMPCNSIEDAKATELKVNASIVSLTDTMFKPEENVDGHALAAELINSNQEMEDPPPVCVKVASTFEHITESNETLYYNFTLAYCDGRTRKPGFPPREQPYVQNASYFTHLREVDLERNHRRLFICDEKSAEKCKVADDDTEHRPLTKEEEDYEAPVADEISTGEGVNNSTNATDQTEAPASSSATGHPILGTTYTIITAAVIGVIGATGVLAMGSSQFLVS